MLDRSSTFPARGVLRRDRLLAMSGVYAVLFLLGLETTIGGAILPWAARELDGFERFPWTGTLQMLASACTTPIAARLGDIHGRKRLLQISIALLCLAGLGSGLAQSMEQLLAMRLFNGVALGMMAATAFAVPADVFPDPIQRIRWQSIGGVMFAVASSVGPLLGAALSEAFGWRAALFAVPLASLVVLGVLAAAPAVPPRHGRPQYFDAMGGLWLGLFILSSLMALQAPAENALDTLSWLAAMAVALTLLWRHSRRVEQPILALEILGNPSARRIVSCTLLTGAVLFVLLFYSPTLLTTVAGMELSRAGACMLPLLVGMPLGSVLNGLLFHRLRRPQWLMAAGALQLALGCLLLSHLSAYSALATVLGGYALCGVGLGFLNQNQTLFMQMVTPVAHVGAATGLVSTARTYGGALGSAVFGLVLGFGDMHAAMLWCLSGAWLIAAAIVPLSLAVRLP